MFSGNAFDRLAIRELIDHQCDAVMRFNPEKWGSAWAQQSVYEIAGQTFTGREAIVKGWLGLMGRIEAVALSAFPGAIEVDGERAAAVTHTLEHVVYKDGTARVLSGIYHDELIREEQTHWRFICRRFTFRVLQMSVPAARLTDTEHPYAK